MIDKICTPVIGGWFNVLRWDRLSSSIATFSNTVNNASTSSTLPLSSLVSTLVRVAHANYKNRLFGIQSDPAIVWTMISYAANDIAVDTRRGNGTTLVVTQEMYNFLLPHKPTRQQIIWVIDQSTPSGFVLVTYRGMVDSDGGYPCQDNGDGTVTLYTVHANDPAYYRAVEVEIPPPVIDEQKVSLNW